MKNRIVDNTQKMKTIVLVGSGHGHLEVINEFRRDEIKLHRFVLVSPHRESYYSGLIPRLIAGEIDDKDLTINSADFAQEKGFLFIQDWVCSIDQLENTVTLSSGQKLQFDLLSMNVGGTPTKLISEPSQTTIYLRPFDGFIPKWRETQRICNVCVSPNFVVVGGGAAAVEVATALRIRLNKNQAFKGEVHLISKSSRLCESYSVKVSAGILESLVNFKINVHLNEEVEQIPNRQLTLKNGKIINFDSIFVVTPTQPSKIVPGKIDSKLRLSSNIFAVGDGTEMFERPNLPRSGVIAVHQGQHLAENIRHILNGQKLKDFVIPKRQLNILITGDRSARLVWGRFSFEGLWPLWIKNWIDERYINKFKKM